MRESDVPNDRTPLIFPRLTKRQTSDEDAEEVNQRSSKYTAPFMIAVGLERFTYYSIVVNLFLFFKYNVYHEFADDGIDDEDDKNSRSGTDKGPTAAIISVMVLIGLSWLFCVLGGWISDAKIGKLKTIILGLIVYASGTGLLLLSTICISNYLKDRQALYRALIVFVSILIAMIGEGAYKANIAAFGAEQLNEKDPVSTRHYFTFYYFSLNIGALLALSVTAYVQQAYGFEYGFGIPFVSICLALLVFVLSRKRYKTLPCQRTVGKVYQIVKEARRNFKSNHNSNSPMTVQRRLTWLDYARMNYGGSFLDWEVDQVKFLFAVLPVFIVLLPYMIIQTQMNATFLQQGIHMDIKFHDFSNFPAAWLSFFNAVTVVIFLPVMDRLVYPFLTKRGYVTTPLRRISIGILVACAAIIAAAIVEIHVVEDFSNNSTVTNPNVNMHSVTAAKLSVFYQLPQYMLIGVSEVFATVGGLEFAYSNAPRSMQGVVMAIFFAINSLGSLLGSGLLELSVVTGLVEKTEHSDYLDLTYYFFLLGALMLLSWVLFIVYIAYRGHVRAKLPRTRMFHKARSSSPPDISDVPDSSYYSPT